MDSEMASTAPISQPLQYMMVTTRQTMPAGQGQQAAARTCPTTQPWRARGGFRRPPGDGVKSRVEPPPLVAGGPGPERAGGPR